MLTFIYYKRREINLKSLNHLINSSILMAYLICLGWSSAYVCGWARAYYYGYSWELVEIGISNIARSLGYIVFFSIIIAFVYSCGIYILHLVKKHCPQDIVRSVRLFVVLTTVLSPIAVVLFLFMKEIDYTAVVIYLLFSIPISIVFNKTVSAFRLQDLPQIINRQKMNIMLIMSSVYIYFILSAFLVGYVRPILISEYATILFEGQRYYILSTNNNILILAKSVQRNNDQFFVFPCQLSNNRLCSLNMVDTAQADISLENS